MYNYDKTKDNVQLCTPMIKRKIMYNYDKKKDNVQL